MKSKLLISMSRWLVVVAMMLGSSAAIAGDPPAADEDDGPRVFNFDGDTISTDYLKPGTMVIEGLRRGRRSSLIQVRLDFVAEILRSAEDI